MVSRRILQRDSELLLTGFTIDQVRGVAQGTSENLWKLLVEVDSLQADAAGVLTWRGDRRGSNIRHSMSSRAWELALTAHGLNEALLAERLGRFAAGLDEFDGQRRGSDGVIES